MAGRSGPLKEYRAKRDPARTPEPVPPSDRPARDGAGNTFVVQEHHARALHWDFRLERDGVLASWAVPKGLPTDPSVNHLAVQTEDHPLEYATFEGTIAAGEYGGGTVSIWDRGTYVAEKWTDREVKVLLNGRRTQGRFVLFRTRGKDWMMHRMDAPPRPDWIALPRDLSPMRAVDARMPRGDGWVHEVCWPGRRVLVRVEGGRVELLGSDERPPATLRELGAALGATQVVLDGVLTTVAGPTVLMLFDVLHHEGSSLLPAACRERRSLLTSLELEAAGWQTPPDFGADGRAALRAAADLQLPGIVAKRADSPYRPGEQSRDWRRVLGGH